MGKSTFAPDQVTALPGASLLGFGRDELETEIGVLRSDRISDAMIDSLALFVQLETPAGNRARILTARTVDHKLDVDGRFAKVATAGLDLYVGAARYALRKHKRVRLRNVPGNHDFEATFWLAECLRREFRDEPRITVA